MAINLDHVTEQITVTDTATNASLTVQPKGTGAFNIAAGSSGLNLSNGGTVTAITTTASGTYTSLPTAVISAPTTAGGVQATFGFSMQITNTPTIASGGTGYTVGDVLTFVGGTFSAVATVTVSTVSAGVVTGITVSQYGSYTALPANPVSITGGTGSGATFTSTWGVRSAFPAPSITNAGSGYVEQPTVTFSGGGGSGADAYATVGSGTAIKSIGSTLDLRTPTGIGFRVSSPTNQLSTNYVVARGAGNPDIGASAGALVLYGGSGQGIAFYSNGYTNAQLAVAHTASAVNYVQATGAATGSGPTISAQGSDTNIDHNLTSKGTGVVNLNTGAGTQVRIIDSGGTAVNRIHLQGQATGFLPVIASRGSDTNLGMSYSTQGTGAHDFYTAGTSFTQQLKVAHTASTVNYVNITGGTTGNSPALTLQGSDANVSGVISTKGTGGFSFYSNNVNQRQFRIIHTASSVNFFDVTGGATGFGAVLSAAGSDTNIPAVVQPKGTGALQAQQTDSTATGGNARGVNAVDFQTSRNAASQVASGSQSIVGGGIQNTSSNSFSVVCGGTGNTASGPASVVTGGQNSTASSTYSIAAGGGNVASGYASVVSGGYGNTAAGTFNFVGGGFINSANALAAVTTQSATMNGTTAVTLSGSNANIKVGQSVTGTSIASFTYVAAISGTSLTLSQAASGSSTSTLSFYTPHGVVVGGGNNQATGSYSFIGGGGDAGTAGNRNVASGDWSFVGNGVRNVASGASSFVGGGGIYDQSSGGYSGNTASGLSSFVGGGFGNTASSNATAISGGVANVANGIYSAVVGGTYGTTRGLLASIVLPASNAPFGNLGGAQSALLILGAQTTDATPTVVTCNGTAASAINQVIMPNNSAYYFRGEIVSGVTGGGNTKGWFIEGVIKRGANAAATSIVGTATVTSNYADVGAATWAIAVTADTTNGGLAVTFTGQLATTIRTVAKISTVEMTF